MGPSGGGKTTLLNLLSGRIKLNSGIISYNDQLYTKSLKKRYKFIMRPCMMCQFVRKWVTESFIYVFETGSDL